MITDIYGTGMIYNDLDLFGVIWSDLKPGLLKITTMSLIVGPCRIRHVRASLFLLSFLTHKRN